MVIVLLAFKKRQILPPIPWTTFLVTGTLPVPVHTIFHFVFQANSGLKWVGKYFFVGLCPCLQTSSALEGMSCGQVQMRSVKCVGWTWVSFHFPYVKSCCSWFLQSAKRLQSRLFQLPVREENYVLFSSCLSYLFFMVVVFSYWDMLVNLFNGNARVKSQEDSLKHL